jgi:hypothetical protein
MHHEYLDLRASDTASYASPGQITKAIYQYSNDTLRLPKTYQTTGTTITHQDDNSYKIIKLSKNSLELQAIDNNGRDNNTLFKHQKQMVFSDSATVFKNNNKSFRFQRLYYEYTEWYQKLVTKILIDSSGIVYYTRGNHAQDDTSIKEYPKTGQLKKAQLNELLTILKTGDLDNFPKTYGEGGTANSIALGFYYNNKTIISRGTEQQFPYAHRNLLVYLKGITNTVTLTQQYNPAWMGF